MSVLTEIATLPTVTRNDRKYFTLTLPSPLKGEGKEEFTPTFALCSNLIYHAGQVPTLKRKENKKF